MNRLYTEGVCDMDTLAESIVVVPHTPFVWRRIIVAWMFQTGHVVTCSLSVGTGTAHSNAQ